MNIYEVFFLIGFLVEIGVFLVKCYNIMGFFSEKGHLYELRMGIILFVVYMIAWFLTLAAWLSNVANSQKFIYQILVSFGSVLLYLNLLLLFIEVIQEAIIYTKKFAK